MQPSGENLAAWLDELPPELGAHAEILRRMLAETEKDPRMRALQVQGSIARGAGGR